MDSRHLFEFSLFSILGALLAACSQTMTGSVGAGQPAAQLASAPAAENSGSPVKMASVSEGPAKAATLPRCAKPIDTIALVETPDAALATKGLTSPLPVLRMIVTQSNCFSIVDRGPALEAMVAEQKITGKTGTGKLAAARYFLTAQIIFQNQGTTNVGSAVSPFMSVIPTTEVSTFMNSIAGNMNATTTDVQTVLFLTDGNTATQVAAAEGSARTSELGFASASLFSGLGGSAYATTDAGKTAAAAMVDAYVKLVGQLSGQQAAAR